MSAADLVRIAPAAAAALVAISAGAALAPLTWHAFGIAGDGALTPRADLPESQEDARVADISAIIAMAPFGAYVAPGEPASPATHETELGLTLRGVLVAARPHESAAFIARGSDLRAYSIGDTIVRGVVLQAVHTGHVELAVSGRAETLTFPDPGTENRNRAGVDAMRARLSPSARAAAAAPRPAAGAPGNATLSPEEVIEDYRQQIASNPQTVLDGLGLEAGEQGYRIREDAPAAVRRAGLRPGDIVMRVNGETVGDVETDRNLFDRVAASGRARVEILRDGRTVTLSFPLQ